MNIWILKYDLESFSDTFIERLSTYVQTIPQLKHHEVHRFSKDKFHFFSISSKGIPKTYNEISEEGVRGYSGILIDKSPEQRDLRNIANVDVGQPMEYYGQFSLFELGEGGFTCFTDVLGFHKVFYGERNGKIYVSNSFEMLKKLGVFEVNIRQMLKDFSTIRFGICPGYNTFLENVFTLPEYGSLEINIEGKLQIKPYKEISELLTAKIDFESKLKETVNDYKTIAKYLRKYHQIAIGLSGGFDGRLILNMFHGTSGNPIETYTYNRAGNLDLKIASVLSRKAKVKHHIFVIEPLKIEDDNLQISNFKDSGSDPFTISFKKALQNFYKIDKEYKVILGGNGGDIDTNLLEKKNKIHVKHFQQLIESFSQIINTNSYLAKEVQAEFKTEIAEYFKEKYQIFNQKDNYKQLFASALFNLERFRGEQGFHYSQNSHKTHDVFAPFAIESFNQLVFLANKSQLQRGLREGIHYRLSYELTDGKIPYAPILTSENEHGNNLFQKIFNKIVPYLPKIIWKLKGGDTNTRMRKQYQSQVNQLYSKYISENKNSIIFDYLDKNEVLSAISQSDYGGVYNPIGSMIKTINDSK